MVQNRKMFASTNTQVSFAEGQVQFNGVTLINPAVLSTMSKDNIATLVNQSTPTNPSQPLASNSSNSNSSSFISSNALKAGVTTLRNFLVQKSVPVDNIASSKPGEYKTIINDLQNVPEMSNILKLLLETGMCIVRKIGTSQKYTEEDALSDATNFIWSFVKMNFAAMLPGINVFDIKYHHLIRKVVQATYDYVKSHSEEWTECFKRHINSQQQEEEKMNASGSYQDSQVRYNDVVLMDPTEVMALPREVSVLVVQEALNSTGSRMNDIDTINLPKDMVKLCEDELEEFFSKHPMAINFKLDTLVDEFKGVLIDLSGFEKRNIIFYKLLVIATNITQGLLLGNEETLEKDVLVDVVKCLWIFVNMNFSQILSEDEMFKQEYESYVVNIVIALYRYQIKEPNKWSSAFYEYRSKFGGNY